MTDNDEIPNGVKPEQNAYKAEPQIYAVRNTIHTVAMWSLLTFVSLTACATLYKTITDAEYGVINIAVVVGCFLASVFVNAWVDRYLIFKDFDDER